jgi:hypothetical protein
VARKRAGDDRFIVHGKVRSFEWYWAPDRTMPGLDAFERLDGESRAAIIATLRHWADLPHGTRVSETRVNQERDHPKIFAAKAGKHRFTVFRGSFDTWVVHRYYRKAKSKLDKAGKAVVNTTIDAIDDYNQRMKSGRYHECN